jgi:hypothetical protein
VIKALRTFGVSRTRPGDLVALDTFYIGKPEGFGPVW